MITENHSLIEEKLREAVDLLDQNRYCEASCLIGESLQLFFQLSKNTKDATDEE